MSVDWFWVLRFGQIFVEICRSEILTCTLIFDWYLSVYILVNFIKLIDECPVSIYARPFASFDDIWMFLLQAYGLTAHGLTDSPASRHIDWQHIDDRLPRLQVHRLTCRNTCLCASCTNCVCHAGMMMRKINYTLVEWPLQILHTALDYINQV